MNKFEQRKIRLLQDIDRMIKTIDDEVNTFIVSRMHTNPKIRKLANEAFKRKKEITIRIAREMSKKYG